MPIKVIAVLDNEIGAGGGFDQALNAICQMKSVCAESIEFSVLTTQEKNLAALKTLGVDSEYLKISPIDSLMAKLAQSFFGIFLFGRFNFLAPIEEKLLARGCDVVYFPTPNALSGVLKRLNYISTVWDVCHRDFPEFPEVRKNFEFNLREANFKNNLASALVVITDSEISANKLSFYYGIDKSRFLPMPFSPSSFLDSKRSIKKKEAIDKYHLQEDYFYYPAQFWAHKNHIRILEALKLLNLQYGWKPEVVFSGRDYGNLEYIKAKTEEWGLSDQVKILGFIPSTDMNAIYGGAATIVVPTYFGPTNLPPLEAWLSRRPLIYSSLFSGQTKDAALLINPDSAEELANAMYDSMKPEIRERLVTLGLMRLEELKAERIQGESRLREILEAFELRRGTWGSHH